MGLFEFLMVLVSIVIGLGVTEILSGWANLLRVREGVRFYWIHVLLQLGVFFALLQQWWEFWDLADVHELTFLAVLVVLAPPILLFLIAHLLFPAEAENADLEDYYYSQSPLLWGLVLGVVVAGTFLPPAVFGYSLFHPANLSGIPMVGFGLILSLSTNPRVHSILVPLVFLATLLDTIVANPAIATG